MPVYIIQYSYAQGEVETEEVTAENAQEAEQNLRESIGVPADIISVTEK